MENQQEKRIQDEMEARGHMEDEMETGGNIENEIETKGNMYSLGSLGPCQGLVCALLRAAVGI